MFPAFLDFFTPKPLSTMLSRINLFSVPSYSSSYTLCPPRWTVPPYHIKFKEYSCWHLLIFNYVGRRSCRLLRQWYFIYCSDNYPSSEEQTKTGSRKKPKASRSGACVEAAELAKVIICFLQNEHRDDLHCQVSYRCALYFYVVRREMDGEVGFGRDLISASITIWKVLHSFQSDYLWCVGK